jgi:hypothetical protein
MMMADDLAARLPSLMPSAVALVEEEERTALRAGDALSARALALARAGGVQHPERIRLHEVTQFPQPDTPALRAAILQAGLLGPGMMGITLGYAVVVRRGFAEDPRLLNREFRHVYQYERLGDVSAFLPVYLAQIVRTGYDNAPLEIDARAHERGWVS